MKSSCFYARALVNADPNGQWWNPPLHFTPWRSSVSSSECMWYSRNSLDPPSDTWSGWYWLPPPRKETKQKEEEVAVVHVKETALFFFLSFFVVVVVVVVVVGCCPSSACFTFRINLFQIRACCTTGDLAKLVSERESDNRKHTRRRDKTLSLFLHFEPWTHAYHCHVMKVIEAIARWTNL